MDKLLILAAAGGALAQGGPWTQCGGKNWSGETSCVSGYSCQFVNDYYSQCLAGEGSGSGSKPTTTLKTSSKPTTTAVATTTTPANNGGGSNPGNQAGSGLKWVGVNEAGAEFGEGNYPGKLGTHYIFPDTSTIQTLIDEGYNIFRVGFAMERMIPDSLTNQPAADYLSGYKEVIDYITKAGAHAITQPHNFGRYYGNVISDADGFKTFWKTFASEFASNDKVIFDTMNEFHSEPQDNVLAMNQAAIDGIRAAGATSQYIFAEGNSWTGAWTWLEHNTGLKALTDPEDKLVYEMHQYLDGDSSGTSETCSSATIGKERLQGATEWLQTNNLKGFIGEFAGGVNSVCEEAVENMLSYMSDNSDVWMGAEWWSAGPMWGSYMYSLEPNEGPAYSTYLPILEKYFVDGSASASTSSATKTAQTTTAAAVEITSTPNTQAEVAATETPSSSSSSTAAAVQSSIPVVQSSAPAPAATTITSIPVDVPTPTGAPTFFSGVAASTEVPSSSATPSATPSAAANGSVKKYYQCGGLNYTGATTCESGSTCVKQNPYYFQCV